MRKILKTARPYENIKRHYEIEKKLAERLKNSPAAERAQLYSCLYNELFRKVPDHPQLTKKNAGAGYTEEISSKMNLMRLFPAYHARPSSLLEIGSGDCRLSLAAAQYFDDVYALEVSEEITKHVRGPGNFHLIISEGGGIDLPPESINIAYSNQLMEHMHPDDAILQLKDIYNVLIKGGSYICLTPHRFAGPHDVSRHFEDVASGFHLKEYTFSELDSMLKSAGFRETHVIAGARGVYAKAPVKPFLLLEKLLERLSLRHRKKISRNIIMRLFLGIRIAAEK